MTQDLCRAEFEKWFEWADGDEPNLDRERDYLLWTGWKAAWKAKPATEHNAADNSQNIEHMEG